MNSLEVEIDGKIYVKIEQNNQETARLSRMSMMLYGMAMMFGGGGTSSYQRYFPKVNLIEEYKLIIAKKSKLSRAERDMVINRFNKNFKLKENEI